MTAKKHTLGWIGAGGRMGLAMAKRLLAAGHDVTVYNRTRSKVEPLAERAAALGVPVRRIPPLPLGLTGARRLPGLMRLLRRERPAVFHAHMSSPIACKWGLAAAVLARLAAEVWTVEVRDLVATRVAGVRYVTGDGLAGLSGAAPFDAVNVAAAGSAGQLETLLGRPTGWR